MPAPEHPSGRPAAADHAAALNDFLALFLRDRDAGRERSLAQYQTRWPQHQELIAAEFAQLTSPVKNELPTIPQVHLERIIGRGGQSAVYRGRQQYVDRTVAVKVLKTALADPSFTGRFRREARALAGLTHPNIVTCYQAGVTDDGACYIVMEFVDGPTLRQWLASNGALAPRAAVEVGTALAQALAHALAGGVIHRDVKPENVLLQPFAGTGELQFRPKLVDLGLVRAVADSGLQTAATPLGALIGTPRTMAPEQLVVGARVDHRADIYGLGCVLYHALTGQPAFGEEGFAKLMAQKERASGPDPRHVVPTVPAPLANLVLRMTAKSPAERPQDYAEVLQQLAAALPPLLPRGGLTALQRATAGIASWWTRRFASRRRPP